MMRMSPFTGNVQPRRSAAGAADNDHGVVLAAGRRFQAQFCGQFGVARLDETGTVVEDDGGNDAFAIVHFDDTLFGVCVLFDVYPLIWDLVFAEELFATAAVRAPEGAIDDKSGVESAVNCLSHFFERVFALLSSLGRNGTMCGPRVRFLYCELLCRSESRRCTLPVVL